MESHNLERIASTCIVLLTAVVGGGAYFTKAEGPTGDEVIRAIKDDAREHEFDVEKQQWIQDSRITGVERSQIMQKEMLDEILEEVKSETSP